LAYGLKECIGRLGSALAGNGHWYTFRERAIHFGLDDFQGDLNEIP
jgi:hypothetical protein